MKRVTYWRPAEALDRPGVLIPSGEHGVELEISRIGMLRNRLVRA